MKKAKKTVHISQKWRCSTWEKAVVLAFVLSLALSTLSFYGRCQSISGKVLRLHVLANSNSESDQTLKYQVRDKLLEVAADLTEGAENREQAEEILAKKVDFLQKTAQNEVISRGYDYSVRAELAETYFTTRSYGAVTLPAGKYRALRITIGEGAGKNWWCVVYPPMCLAAAEKKEDLHTVLTEEENRVVDADRKIEIRFKIVEWWEKLLDFFS